MSYSYHVVEFEKLPYDGVAKFACIPDAWVQPVKTENNKEVMILYPDQNEPNIERLVKNNSKCANTTTWYKAYMRHSTDTYERAKEIEQDLNLTNMMEHIGIEEEARTPSNSTKRNERQSTGSNTPSTPQAAKALALADIPGYDKNDIKCKWTLKYPNQPEGKVYVALRPKKPRNVKVMVSSDELNDCLKDPRGIHELATKLLKAVFKEEALAQCPFYKPGSKTNAFLNENAKDQIKEYIEEVASEHDDWPCPEDYIKEEMSKALARIRKSLKNAHKNNTS